MLEKVRGEGEVKGRKTKGKKKKRKTGGRSTALPGRI